MIPRLPSVLSALFFAACHPGVGAPARPSGHGTDEPTCPGVAPDVPVEAARADGRELVFDAPGRGRRVGLGDRVRMGAELALDGPERPRHLVVSPLEPDCGAYGECVSAVLAPCGEDRFALVVPPDYHGTFTASADGELVETVRVAGSQADEADRIEAGEPLTREVVWERTPRGFSRPSF